VVASLWDMVIPSLKTAWSADSVWGTLRGAKGQERNQIRRVMRGGGGGDAVSRVTGDERKSTTSLFSEGVKTAMDGNGLLDLGGCDGRRLLLRGATGVKGVALGSRLWAVTAGGPSGCSAWRHAVVLSNSVSRQRIDTTLCQCFLHLIPLDVSICEVDAFVRELFFLSLNAGRVIRFVHPILFAGQGRLMATIKAHTEYLTFHTEERYEMVHITPQVEEICAAQRN